MGIPLVALGVKPPQIDNYQDMQARAAGIQNMRGQNALQPGQLQEQQLQIKAFQQQEAEKKALDEAWKGALKPDEQGVPQIDSAALTKAAAASGLGHLIPQITESVDKVQKSKNDLIKQHTDIQKEHSDLLGHIGYAVQQADYNPQMAHTLFASLGETKDPQIAQMHQLIDGDPAKFKQVIDTMVNASPFQQTKQGAIDVAKIRANAQKEGELPLGDKVQQLNQGLARRFQVLNPGQALPADYTLPANATQKDFDRIDKLLGQTENAQGVKAQQQTSNDMRKVTLTLAQQAAADRKDKGDTARADKSFQFNSTQLEKMGKPVEDASTRLGRLQDTLAQNSPQADALVAPELLTVMAGGAGSGLRMNEAEIARVIGGRSKWESLKADINKWQLDPTQARSITPAQQQQIRALTGAVQKKLLDKQGIINDARTNLMGTDDPNQHRKIVADTHQKLTAIDETSGQSGSSGPVTATGPNGHKIVVKDGKWVDAQTGAPIQ